MKHNVSVTRPGLLEYAYWAFLLIAVGRVNQLIPAIGPLHLAKVSTVLALLAWLVSHRQATPLPPRSRAMGSTAGWIAAIAVALTPISIWPGASFIFVTTILPPLICSVLIARAMRESWTALRRTFIVLLLCGVILSLFAILTYKGGRADDSATMYDPNDLAYVIVTVMPLALALAVTSRSRVQRIGSWLMTATLIGALLLTQSRGGLLGLVTVVVLATLFPIRSTKSNAGQGRKRTWRQSIVGLLVVFCVASVVWANLPLSAQQRFSTLLHIGTDYNLDPNDKTGRGQIWLAGLRGFINRPIGYGPNSFEMVDLRFAGEWKAPHNSFLEVGVELGAIGLILFIRMYYLALTGLQATQRKLLSHTNPTSIETEQAAFARAIQLSLAGNIVSGSFLSQAYAQILWVTFGLCMALLAIAPHRPATPFKPAPTAPSADRQGWGHRQRYR